jgi:hypothetical protein
MPIKCLQSKSYEDKTLKNPEKFGLYEKKRRQYERVLKRAKEERPAA